MRASAKWPRRSRERYAGRTLTLIGVLKGSVFFLTALARYIDVPVKIDFLAISSFSNKSGSPGVVRIAKDLDESIEGEDVLLVEDIVDTGFTLRYLLQTLAGRAPNSLSVCTFLDRNSRRIVQVPVDLSLLRDPRPFRGRLRPRLPPALPQPGLRGRDEARESVSRTDSPHAAPAGRFPR